jgi:hypothetical protein
MGIPIMANLNISAVNQAHCNLMDLYSVNHSIGQPWHTVFAILYAIVASMAFFCNLFLLIALYKDNKKHPRINQNIYSHAQTGHSTTSTLSEKTRNHLIGCLASLDLLLSITMPFTAIDLLTNYWPLGIESEILAKLVRSVPAVIVYCSSMVIILIATHCYRQVVHPSKRQITPSEIPYIAAGILLFSILISIPIYHYTKLEPLLSGTILEVFKYFNSNSHDMLSCRTPTTPNLMDISFCIDDWPSFDGIDIRLIYGMVSLLVQVVIPSIVICKAYFSIYQRLKHQREIQSRVRQRRQQEDIINERRRNRRRNILLVSVSFVFVIAWLPLGLFATLSDAKINIFGDSPEVKTIVFMICHLFGMSSACINPVIYGYRNKNIRKGKCKDIF